jgi:hypothetical protein
MAMNFKMPEAYIARRPADIDKNIAIPVSIKLSDINIESGEASEALSDASAIILKAAEDAIPGIIVSLGQALDRAMMSGVWSWDDGVRDIVDTGRLMASRAITVSGNVISIDYDVPYFGIIHFGGYIIPYGNERAEKVYIPARPWVTYVVEGGGPVPQFDFDAAFRDALTSFTA